MFGIDFNVLALKEIKYGSLTHDNSTCQDKFVNLVVRINMLTVTKHDCLISSDSGYASMANLA